MIRFCDNIRDLDIGFVPRKRGFIDRDEMNIVRETLEIIYMSNEELFNLRNAVVVYFSHHKPKDDMVAWDKMSAIVAVIDDEKWKRGMEV